MHQYLITRPVPGQELPRQTPVVRDPENLVYVREEVGGYLVGGFEPDPKAWRLDDVPWEFTQQLLPAEWELFEPLLAGAIRRFPAVEKAEILQLVNGPDGFTPDGHYALGPVPGRPGLWVAAGMSINGIAGAGGVGRVMAEWILEGEPSIDVWELNVRRFGAHLGDRRYAAEKAREVYRYYYAPQFPCDESEWGRPLRTSPLLERLLALGAVFGERGGWERAHYFVPGRPGRRQGADERTWERPSYWEHVAREHRAVRERVGVLDMTSFGKLDVTGPGALGLPPAALRQRRGPPGREPRLHAVPEPAGRHRVRRDGDAPRGVRVPGDDGDRLGGRATSAGSGFTCRTTARSSSPTSPSATPWSACGVPTRAVRSPR